MFKYQNELVKKRFIFSLLYNYELTVVDSRININFMAQVPELTPLFVISHLLIYFLTTAMTNNSHLHFYIGLFVILKINFS